MKMFDDEQILQDLPVALARQVKESLFCDILGNCPPLDDVPLWTRG
jgi:hypothetical protein